MKHQVIALKKHPGNIEINGVANKLNLPKGCTGILFTFESTKTARAWTGNDVQLVRISDITDKGRERHE